MPIHHGDFTVFRSPLADFLDEVRRRRPATEVVTLERGETLRLQLAA